MIVNARKNILIVGLGLMGGSYGQALKRYGFHVSAITRSQKSIDYAVENGIIDDGTTEIDKDLIGNADFVVFALYPHVFIEWIEKYQQYFKPGCLITDVTGVKSSVVYKIQDMLRDDVEFIAAHPMAGREVYGVENSKASMFQNANYIVTPTKKNTKKAIDTCKEIGLLLGFGTISELTPEKHDEMIAFVSQLTHCIAVALMTCNDEENMERFTGDSFRDLTRIARINDVMWSELFITNKQQLLKQMELFMDKFNEMKTQIENDDVEGLRETMRYSTERRAMFDKK